MFNLTFAHSMPTCTILILHIFEIRRDEPFHKNKIKSVFLTINYFFYVTKIGGIFFSCVTH